MNLDQWVVFILYKGVCFRDTISLDHLRSSVNCIIIVSTFVLYIYAIFIYKPNTYHIINIQSN